MRQTLPPRPQVLLECVNLCSWYGQAQILFDVNLEIHRGEVVALMGRNGAGKSSTLKALMGLMPRTRGEVYFLGTEQSQLEPFEAACRGMAYVPEDRRIFSDLTVLENLSVGRQPARAFPDGQEVPYWDFERLGHLFPNLAKLPHQRGSQLSGGEQQMLSIARSLMGNPLVLLLDEPSEGLSPLVVEQMAEMILTLKAQGVSVLLSEQNLQFAQWVCDRVYVIEGGEIVHQSSIQAWSPEAQTRISEGL